MSLEGIRDFSVIATAPERRLAVKTFVHAEEPGLIREAVIRELKRGGQVYFLHNEVETIENRREQLAALIPEARIAVAHGQMSERELEHIMREFYQQRYNLLLCTTIIETGRQARPRAAPPAARPRRPKPPSGLRLPAHPALGRHDEAGEAAPRSHPVP